MYNEVNALQEIGSPFPDPPPALTASKLKTLFRQYDIRGVVTSHLLGSQQDISRSVGEPHWGQLWPHEPKLSLQLAYAIGCAYGAEIQEREQSQETPLWVAIGYDARLSGPRLSEALECGLRRMGVNVLRLGLVPTPVVYFATYELAPSSTETDSNSLVCHGGIAVTGSHNPSDWNGFKLSIGKESIYGEQLQRLARRVIEADYLIKGRSIQPRETQALERDLSDQYLVALRGRLRLPQRPLHNLKIVIDAGHGASGPLATRFFNSLGAQVYPLYCEPNGRFPAHHPDPTVEENLTDLKAKVIKEGADVGLGFDGDGDRLGVVDREGVVLWGDQLLLLFAQHILSESPGATIIGEVKCSDQLYDGVKSAGGVAEMWKVGHSLIKARMRETGAPLAGEMSGHIFFADRFYGFDDAIYVGARLIELLVAPDFELSVWRRALPATLNTPELRVYCEDQHKSAVIKRFSEAFSARYPVSAVDGARVKFQSGWGLVRASNTQPVLVMRFEASTQELLSEYRSEVERWLKARAPEVCLERDPNH